MSFDMKKRAGLIDSTKLESPGRIVVSLPSSAGRANHQSRKPRTKVLRCFAFARAIISDTPTWCGHARSQRWHPRQYSSHAVSAGTPSQRRRSSSGPRCLGPGYCAWAPYTGHTELHTEHFRQLSRWNSSSRIVPPCGCSQISRAVACKNFRRASASFGSMKRT